MRHNARRLARGFALACLAACGGLGGAAAADLQFSLPTLTAPPGATVVVPIEADRTPDGLGIQSLEFRMDFTPGTIDASTSWGDGWAQAWGPAFVNGNASFIAVAAAGYPAIASGGTRVNTLQLTVSASAVPGTDMPLTLQHVLCNEGSPSVAVVPGLLRVRATSGVGPAGGSAFALSAPAPNPILSGTRFTLTVPDGGEPSVRLEVFALDGRRVRRLADGPLPAGRHEFGWDARDANGERVRPGLYFVRADRGTGRLQRRIVVAN